MYDVQLAQQLYQNKGEVDGEQKTAVGATYDSPGDVQVNYATQKRAQEEGQATGRHIADPDFRLLFGFSGGTDAVGQS